MSGTPYRLQNRQAGGVVIRQGRSYVTLQRDEIKSLVRELNTYLDDPIRVEETTGIDRA
ncbi:hypothetical protein ACXPWS_07615 [Mycobacterium sp. BMJ-28]